MDGINDIMRKRLSLQHRGKNMIWSIAMNEIKSYLKIEKIDTETQDEILTWYVRHNKLFIKTSEQSLKIQIFKEKTNIIKNINQKLSEIWYKTEIEDIILK
jgi:rRNA-processing protein FCF1